MVFPSASQLCLDFPYLPEIGSPFFPCRRWRLLDPHVLPLPVKPGKSRQIVANERAPSLSTARAFVFQEIDVAASLRQTGRPRTRARGEGGLPGTRTINYQHQ